MKGYSTEVFSKCGRKKDIYTHCFAALVKFVQHSGSRHNGTSNVLEEARFDHTIKLPNATWAGSISTLVDG